MPEKRFLSVNEAWTQIIEDYDIVNEVEKNGIFKITANEIKKYKEPRLMAKWDSSESLPSALKKRNLNILPDSRGSYVIGKFNLYEEVPELDDKVENMTSVTIPDYETIDIKNIGSESNAINILVLSGILDDFLGTKNSAETFNGRMGTGKFEYDVETTDGNTIHIDVDRAQCEIDGGFENEDSVIILEAKNVVHPDFHIRQLYYPYRLWKERVTKPIRLVFAVYSNKIFRLYEYQFKDYNDYSSIDLMHKKSYSLEETSITLNNLKSVREKTDIITNDNQEDADVPFPQADSFERIISLLENLQDNPMTPEEIAELMQFELRQSDYYFNAGKYLGLFEKINDDGVVVKLTEDSKPILKLDYKQRQLALVERLLQHQIFADLFDYTIKNNNIPEKELIKELMQKYNVCNEEVTGRRSQTVSSWVRWMFNLIKL